MLKIVYNRAKCIGAGSCEALSEKHWKVRKDGKAELINGRREFSEGDNVKFPKGDAREKSPNGDSLFESPKGDVSPDDGEIFSKVIDESELETAKEFCWGCPSKAIHIFDDDKQVD